MLFLIFSWFIYLLLTDFTANLGIMLVLDLNNTVEYLCANLHKWQSVLLFLYLSWYIIRETSSFETSDLSLLDIPSVWWRRYFLSHEVSTFSIWWCKWLLVSWLSIAWLYSEKKMMIQSLWHHRRRSSLSRRDEICSRRTKSSPALFFLFETKEWSLFLQY